MLKHLLVFICFIIPCASHSCNVQYRYQRPMVHAMRTQENVPVAKHPIVPRRVASARRVIRY